MLVVIRSDTFTEPRNRFQGMNSVSLCSLAGRYDNPISTRCLAPIDCLKIPALAARYDKQGCRTGPQAGNRFLGSLKVYKYGLRSVTSNNSQGFVQDTLAPRPPTLGRWWWSRSRDTPTHTFQATSQDTPSQYSTSHFCVNEKTVQ